MYLGYAALGDVEVWNNARTLDYLAGDPLAGIAGLSCTGTFVNRDAACRTHLPLVCDPPARFGVWSVQFGSYAQPGGWETGLLTSEAFGEVASFSVSNARQFVYDSTDGSSDSPPPVPPFSDPGWTSLPPIPSAPPPRLSPVVTVFDGPCQGGFVAFRVSRTGGSEFFDVIGWLATCPPGPRPLWSTDGGATWSASRSILIPVSNIAESGRYLTPEIDLAPWFDAQVPESAEFAGLYVEEVTGFDSVVNREVTDAAVIGSAFGPLRLRGRSLTVTGWLRAKTCAAAEYGLSWLTEALMGDQGCDDCATGALTMIRSCPPAGADLDPARYIRTLLNVGLVDGPKVTDRAGVCCEDCGSTMLRVQFTLASTSPFIFSESEWLAFRDSFDQGPFAYDLSWPCAGGCPEAPEPWRPDCAPASPPPPTPISAGQGCYCEPWETMRRCVSYENTNQWNEVTSYIEVQAGIDEVRNLKIVAFKNVPGRACPCDYENDEFWRCVEPCASVGIAQIPPGARLVIDSRVRQITMTLPGGQVVEGMSYVSSLEEGRPFDWFDIGHCTSLCMVASVAASSTVELNCSGPTDDPEEPCSDAAWVERVTVPDAVVSIGLVNRYVASGS